MSTSPALPPFLVSASIAEEKKYQVRYARLWADCVEVGGEWLTEERWRAEGQVNRKALALEKLIRRQPWRRRGPR